MHKNFPFVIKSRLSALATILPALLFFALTSTASAAGMSGAIFTTDSLCAGTNVNIFTDKIDVYLDGGPHHVGSAGLPDGDYYAQVTTPSGTVLGHTLTASVNVSG